MTPVILLAILLCQDATLTNGSFEEWKGGRPVGWTVGVGARNGEGKASVLEAIEGGGISLRGDADTRTWRIASQSFAAAPGDFFRVSFTGRAADLRRDGNQFLNHYAGMAFLNAAGETLKWHILQVTTAEWTDEEVIAAAPPGTDRGEVRVFLSISGRLDLRKVTLDPLVPADSFDALVRHMDRYYSYFENRKIDWEAVAARHQKREGKFVPRIRAMLAELKDSHIWIDPPGAGRIAPWRPRLKRNFNNGAISRRLEKVERIGRVGFVGRTAEGYGYVAVTSLMDDGKLISRMEKAIEGLFDAPGIIVDLRANGGGWEENGRRIARLFADTERVYAKHTVRAGAAHDRFTKPWERKIGPREGKTYARPVVCLTGPMCVSSGEALALMMKVLPHVTLVGLPTQGASGNPQPVTLPNGVKVWFSRWVAMRPDGTSFEGEGIKPDVTVEHTGKGDPTLEAGVRELKKRIK